MWKFLKGSVIGPTNSDCTPASQPLALPSFLLPAVWHGESLGARLPASQTLALPSFLLPAIWHGESLGTRLPASQTCSNVRGGQYQVIATNYFSRIATYYGDNDEPPISLTCSKSSLQQWTFACSNWLGWAWVTPTLVQLHCTRVWMFACFFLACLWPLTVNF